jgi:hypothetical protein
MKAIVCYVLLHYDFKFPVGMHKHGEVPEETWIGTGSVPSNKTELLFRKREHTL